MSLAKYLDLSKVAAIRIEGRGGKEDVLRPVLKNWRRVSEQLYDYVSPEGAIRLEVKKQEDLQWFDIGKYHNLTARDRSIRLLFVLHWEGRIIRIIATRLGKLINFLRSREEYRRLGWNEDVFETAARFKNDYPKLQFKVPIHVRRLCYKHSRLFETLYSPLHAARLKFAAYRSWRHPRNRS
jgi:hypothetical protein